MQDLFGWCASVGVCALLLTFATDCRGQCVIGGPAPGAAFDDGWGTAVAISADGLTAIIGGPGFDHANGLGDCGGVRILIRNGADWQQQALIDAFTLNPSAPNSSEFGAAVDISADGNTAIVGMPADQNGLRVGSVRILVRNSVTQIWSQQARLLDPTPVNNGRFGEAVAISDDGNTVVVGQPGYPFNGITPGAYVFKRTGTTWGRATLLPAARSPGTDDEYGASVALSPDGMVAAVGAPRRINSATSHGAAHVYRFNVASWIQEASLSRSVAFVGYFDDVERFGHALSLTGDAGNEQLAVGDPQNSELLVASNQNCSNGPPGTCRVAMAGCVHLYQCISNAWGFQTTLHAPEVEFSGDLWSIDSNDRFGNAVSLRGNHLVVGAWGDDAYIGGDGFDNNGSVYLFEGNSMQQHVLHSFNFTNDSFGTSVDISADGQTYIAGAPRGDLPTLNFTGTAEIIDANTSVNLITVDPAKSVFDITITFPGNDPPPQTFTVHLSGRLYANIGFDCADQPASTSVQDYDTISSVETSFTVALPGSQSATFGQMSMSTTANGHAASLNSQGQGHLYGYGVSATFPLLSTTHQEGCPASCTSNQGGGCTCTPILLEILNCLCYLIEALDGNDLAGTTWVLSILDLDETTTFDLGLGANNPTVRITGGINVPLPCPADINSSGGVNTDDLIALITTWGSCGDCDLCPADVASPANCAVDTDDLIVLITSWGDCP